MQDNNNNNSSNNTSNKKINEKEEQYQETIKNNPQVLFSNISSGLINVWKSKLSFVLFLTAKTDYDKTQGIALFLTQLILNLLWSPVFFYWHNLELSLIIIVLLVAFTLATIVSFYKISPLASFLLIPYFLWICFATYLNYGFMVMN